MLLDMLEGFKNFYAEYGDAPIIENYPLKEGLYIRINDIGMEDSIFISNNVDMDGLLNKEELNLINWFKARDYLSILPLYSTNKAIKSKSIHSNNCFTIFIKKKNILKKEKTVKKAILDTEDYFDRIEDFLLIEKTAKTHKNKQANIKILELAPEIDIDLFYRSKSSILRLIKKINEIKEAKELNNDEYIRIFYNADIEEYKAEYTRYMLRKVFNKSKYHTITETGEVIGLPGTDVVTNPKKPGLELKSMKCVVPIRVSFEKALLLQKIYDFLYFYKIPRKIKGEKGETETIKVNSLFKTLYIPYNWDIRGKELTEYTQYTVPMHYVRTGMGTSFSIVDYDIIPPFERQINFKTENVLGKKYRDKTTEKLELWKYSTLNTLEDLENYIDYTFFNYQLSRNYFKYNIRTSVGISKNIVNLIQLSKKSFYDWFKKGNSLEIQNIISKLTLDIICEYMNNIDNLDSYYKLIDMMNLRITLLKYFDLGGDVLQTTINNIKAKLKNVLQDSDKKHNNKQYSLDNDKEFFYLAGQLAYFLSTKSESKNKSMNMSRKYLHTRTVSDMKNVIISMYEKYSYKISMYDIRFKGFFNLIINYASSGLLKENKDFFLAGFLGENLLFQPKNQTKGKAE